MVSSALALDEVPEAVFWAKTPLEKLSNRPVPIRLDSETNDGEENGFVKGSFAKDSFDNDGACIVNNPQIVRKSKAESITTIYKVNDSDSYLF
tara:strand:+ start:757 stop:1035 length:279 start_codon:yes stop_codon:yes gene_type:complete